MKKLIRGLVKVAGFLFGDLIPFAVILMGAIFFVVVIPDYALALTFAWAIAVIALTVRYTNWY